MKNNIHSTFLRAAISGIGFLAISLGTITQLNARTFFANDFASYKAAVDAINANNSGADTIRITGNILMEGSLGIIGDLTVIGDTNPDGTPKYTVDGSGVYDYGIGVRLQNYCTIENVKTTNFIAGIMVVTGNSINNANIKINNCMATNNLYCGIWIGWEGYNTNYQQKIAITNCISSNNAATGILSIGVRVQYPEDFIIHNCVCNNNSQGIYVNQPENLSIVGCVANENFGGEGIRVYGEGSNNHIIMDNCMANGNTKSGISVENGLTGKAIISNSMAANNGTIGFDVRYCRLTNCIADNNKNEGFKDSYSSYYDDCSIFDQCTAMNNGGSGFSCANSLISNSTAVNNKATGMNGRCIINCTSSLNGPTGLFTSGKIYNSITYGHATDISTNTNLYNSVYATGTGKEILNCTRDNPKLQGKTASGEDTDDPAQIAYFALGEGSSALGLADRSWITKENIMEALDNRSWFSDILTEEYLVHVLLQDQIGNIRQFIGDRYDAGSIAKNEDPDAITYTPKKAGNYGRCSMVFYGYNLDGLNKITLKKQSESDIVPETLKTEYSATAGVYKCFATFNFTNRKVGKWDIVLDFGDEIRTLEEGFEIEAYIEPEIELDIFGPSNIRNGAWTSYIIKYTNQGNATVYCQPIIAEIITSKELSIEVRERWEYVHTDGVYTDKYATIDGLVQKLDTLHDFLGANAYSTFVTPLILSIPPYGKGSFTFDMKFSVNGIANEPIEVRAYTLLPFGDLDPETSSSTLKSGGANNTFFGSPCVDAMASTAWDIGKNFIPGADCAIQVVESTYSLATTEENQLANAAWEMGKVIVECASDALPGGAATKTAVKIFKYVSTAKDWVEHYEDLQNCGGSGGGPKKHNSWGVGSKDPNDKCGPVSESGSTWFSDRKEFTYVINFENDSEATAPAQQVWVTDTLDLNVFDINSFEAEILKMGGRIIETPAEQQNFTWTVDMRPDMDLITKVTLTLDKSKGIATWYFKSIDPNTGELPTDALAGFLPPNDDEGSGQGLVMFTIKLKEGLADDVVVANLASIVFDNNEAILTPEWVNEKDIVPPTSAMLQPANSAGVVELKWEGEDNPGGSGIYCYDVYMKQDNSDYEMILGRTTATSTPFTIVEGVNYSFYTIATDHAGNRENNKTKPDITLSLNNVPFDNKAKLSAYPNPVPQGNKLTIEGTTQGKLVEVYNFMGVCVSRATAPGNVTELMLSLPAGIYMVRSNNESVKVIIN